LADDIIKLKMNDVKELKNIDNGISVNTGSPHFVKFVDTLQDYPVTPEGRAIRIVPLFIPLVQCQFCEELGDNTLFVRTYERGVEEETLSLRYGSYCLGPGSFIKRVYFSGKDQCAGRASFHRIQIF